MFAFASTSSWKLVITIVLWQLLLSMGFRIHSQVQRLSNPRTEMMAIETVEATKKLVTKSDMILVVPMERIKVEEIGFLQKAIPNSVEISIISASKLIQAVDGTPFCQLAGMVSGSNFCVFVERDTETIYEIFTKWIKQLGRTADNSTINSRQPQREFYICKKGHIIRTS